MDRARQSLLDGQVRVIRKLGFWLILGLFVLLTLPHYYQAFEYPVLLTYLIPGIGLTRHTLERILYLVPIVWAGFLFGFKGTAITSLVALACMLPRAIFISPSITDTIAETGAVLLTGSSVSGVLALSSNLLRREREHHTQLEMAQQELKTSEERYRELFENAHDAIWVHDMDGNILTANKATARLTGYDVETLIHMKGADFLSQEGLELAREIRRKLLQGETIDGSYDQRIIKKDGVEAFLRLSSNLICSDGEPLAFQNIARDVTEEKRLQENLRFYLEQATRAQEEERKRISRELHDETIQALVVLSRQLDALASSGKGMSEDNRLHLEELRQQTNNIMQGLRRLSQDLRPAALDRLGLLAALEWLASDVAEYSGIVTKVNVLGSEHRLTEEVELVLFRVIQEALRNVWRHSEATRAEIKIEFDQDKTKILVSDNGKGFSLPQTIGDLAKDGKLGLAGMQERARLIGATLTVQSQPGRGSTVTIELSA
ncbi:PAS domain S-box protein [Chloroflexota bacterium]